MEPSRTKEPPRLRERRQVRVESAEVALPTRSIAMSAPVLAFTFDTARLSASTKSGAVDESAINLVVPYRPASFFESLSRAS